MLFSKLQQRLQEDKKKKKGNMYLGRTILEVRNITFENLK